MSPIFVAQFTQNLHSLVKGGDLSMARNYASRHPGFVEAMKPHQRRLVNNACKAWGCPPVI
jgi:hypothetical protein